MEQTAWFVVVVALICWSFLFFFFFLLAQVMNMTRIICMCVECFCLFFADVQAATLPSSHNNNQCNLQVHGKGGTHFRYILWFIKQKQFKRCNVLYLLIIYIRVTKGAHLTREDGWKKYYINKRTGMPCMACIGGTLTKNSNHINLYLLIIFIDEITVEIENRDVFGKGFRKETVFLWYHFIW